MLQSYFCNIANRFGQWNQQQDAIAALCGKSWLAYNETGDTEKYIFRQNGTILISINGDVMEGKWEYLSETQNLFIKGDTFRYLFNPIFADSSVLALQKDGTNYSTLLVEESKVEELRSIQSLQIYISSTLENKSSGADKPSGKSTPPSSPSTPQKVSNNKNKYGIKDLFVDFMVIYAIGVVIIIFVMVIMGKKGLDDESFVDNFISYYLGGGAILLFIGSIVVYFQNSLKD